MNTVQFIPAKPANRHGKPIAALILIATFPLSFGSIFHSPWLIWTGIALIGIACLWLAVAELRDLFLPWPKFRVVRTNSKPMLDEFLRLGWTLRPEQAAENNEPCDYLLEWLREEDPPPPDLSKLSDSAV